MNEQELLEYKLIVKSIIKKFSIRGYDYEDLYLEGLLTATQAIKEFDPSFNTKKTTYVYLRVKRKLITLHRFSNAQKRRAQEQINLESTTLEETGALYNMQSYVKASQETTLEIFELKKELLKEVSLILNSSEMEILTLHLTGYSNKEICEIKNTLPKVISNKLYYIKSKLKKNSHKFEKFKKIL